MIVDAIDDIVTNTIGTVPDTKDKVHSAQDELSLRTHKAATGKFPNCALNVVQAGLAREKWGSERLRSLSQDVKGKLGQIDLLLALNTELTALTDQESYKLTPKMQSTLSKLKAGGIEIWKEGDTITKVQLSELKAQVSSHIDKLRTALQTTISTEIQPEINNLQAIIGIIKQVIERDERFKKKTQELPR